MSNLTVENVYIRENAKQLARKHFWKLLGMLALFVFIPYALSTAATLLLSLTQNKAIIAIVELVTALVSFLLSSGLTLGLTSAMIDLCRGEQNVPVSRVFSRMGECFKAFCLNLWVELKVLLWALPIYVILAMVALMPTYAAKEISPEYVEPLQVFVMVAPVCIMVLAFALTIPAALRYSLSFYVLADKPETGVFDCVNQSKAMMKGHKWQAVKLVLPVLLVMLVILLVLAIVFGTVATLLGLSATSFGVTTVLTFVTYAAMLYYLMRMYLCYTLFYLKRAEGQSAEQTE